MKIPMKLATGYKKDTMLEKPNKLKINGKQTQMKKMTKAF